MGWPHRVGARVLEQRVEREVVVGVVDAVEDHLGVDADVRARVQPAAVLRGAVVRRNCEQVWSNVARLEAVGEVVGVVLLTNWGANVIRIAHGGSVGARKVCGYVGGLF